MKLLYRSAELAHQKAQDRLCGKPVLASAEVQTIPEGQSSSSADVLWIHGLQALAGVGITQSDSLALEYFQQAANEGHASAQYNLGWMYRNGRGVAQDAAQAVKWYRLAAEQGEAIAQNNLGWMYENGRGVAQDDVQAVKWYRLAAEQGYASAQRNLGRMYRNDQVNISPNEAIEYRKDIQLRGVPKAIKALRVCAQIGEPTAKYHFAMVEGSSAITEMLQNQPNEFFEALMSDDFLKKETQYHWLKTLFDEQHRTRSLFENGIAYNNRSKLNPDYLMTLNMEVAQHRYAYLATSKLPSERKEGVTINLSKALLNQKSESRALIKLLKTIPEEHAHYAEAQLLLAHLHYRLDKENPEWQQHFKACENADVERKWIDRQSIPDQISANLIANSIPMINAYLNAFKMDDLEQMSSLRQTEIQQIGENKLAIGPLLRLSIMTVNRERRDNYLLPLKALGVDKEEASRLSDSIILGASGDAPDYSPL